MGRHHVSENAALSMPPQGQPLRRSIASLLKTDGQAGGHGRACSMQTAGFYPASVPASFRNSHRMGC